MENGIVMGWNRKNFHVFQEHSILRPAECGDGTATVTILVGHTLDSNSFCTIYMCLLIISECICAFWLPNSRFQCHLVHGRVTLRSLTVPEY